MLHDVAEPCDVETKLEQATDNLSNSQENFVEGRQVRFSQFVGVLRGIYSTRSCTLSIPYNRNDICETHMIRCGPTKAKKVRCQYGLVNT